MPRPLLLSMSPTLLDKTQSLGYKAFEEYEKEAILAVVYGGVERNVDEMQLFKKNTAKVEWLCLHP